MYGQPTGYQTPQAYGGQPSHAAAGYQAPGYSAPQQYQQPYQGGYQAPSQVPGQGMGYQTPQQKPVAYQPPSAAYNPYSAGQQGYYAPPSQVPQQPVYQTPSAPYQPPQSYGPPSSAPGAPYATAQPPSAYQPPMSAYGSPSAIQQQPIAHAPSAYQPPSAAYAPPMAHGVANVGYAAPTVVSHGMPHAYAAPQTTTVYSGSPAPVVVGAPSAVGMKSTTTIVTYGDGTIFQVPSRWTIKQAWGWSDMYIKDEWGNDVFYADAKSYSLSRNLGFTDLRTGLQIAYIKEKLKLGMPKFGIWTGGLEVGTVSQKFTLISPKFIVRALTGAITINGDWTAHSFTFQRGHRVVASVAKDGFSHSDTYHVTIQPGEDVIFILACCIIIDKCMTYN